MYIFLTQLNLILMYTHVFCTSKSFVWPYTVSEVYISPLVFVLKFNTHYTSAITDFFLLNIHLSIHKPGLKFNALLNTVYILPDLTFNAYYCLLVGIRFNFLDINSTVLYCSWAPPFCLPPIRFNCSCLSFPYSTPFCLPPIEFNCSCLSFHLINYLTCCPFVFVYHVFLLLLIVFSYSGL